MTKMVVFDMAGTTVDEDNVVYKTVQAAINEQGFALSLEQVLAEGAGKEKLQAIKSILAAYAHNINEQLALRIFDRFNLLLTQAYDTLAVKEQKNATRLFHALKERGIRVVLNTGYQFETAKGLVHKLGWVEGKDFDGLVTASDVIHNRPNPDMILLAMKRFQVDNSTQVVKVGDSIIDIEEGKNAGCGLTIGITTGAHTRTQLQSAEPDHIIDDLLQLLPLLN